MFGYSLAFGSELANTSSRLIELCGVLPVFEVIFGSIVLIANSSVLNVLSSSGSGLDIVLSRIGFVLLFQTACARGLCSCGNCFVCSVLRR